MYQFIKKFFNKDVISKTKNKDDLFEVIKEMSFLSNDINKKKKKIDETEYNYILKNKEEYFITLSDFLNLIEKENISINDIIKLCKHISDIDTKNFSYIDVYPIIEENKIILALDKQIEYEGDKIRVVTTKRLTK